MIINIFILVWCYYFNINKTNKRQKIMEIEKTRQRQHENLLGSYIQEKMRQSGYETQVAFAKEVGMKHSTLSAVIKGHFLPNQTARQNMARVFGVDVEELEKLVKKGRTKEVITQYIFSENEFEMEMQKRVNKKVGETIDSIVQAQYYGEIKEAIQGLREEYHSLSSKYELLVNAHTKLLLKFLEQ